HTYLPLTPSRPSFSLTATAASEPSTLSLHDALPIYDAPALHDQFRGGSVRPQVQVWNLMCPREKRPAHKIPHLHLRAHASTTELDRKSTRLNSSHLATSYALFCLKKKKRKNYITVKP